MEERKHLGKISHIEMGIGGHNEDMFGITFSLEWEGSGTQDFWGTWSLKRPEYAKWTEEERIRLLGEMCMRVVKLLQDAKKYNIADLRGIPIEITTEGNILRSWRVLTEVL